MTNSQHYYRCALALLAQGQRELADWLADRLGDPTAPESEQSDDYYRLAAVADRLAIVADWLTTRVHPQALASYERTQLLTDPDTRGGQR